MSWGGHEVDGAVGSVTSPVSPSLWPAPLRADPEDPQTSSRRALKCDVQDERFYVSPRRLALRCITRISSLSFLRCYCSA